MKLFIAGSLIALTLAAATPASALNIHVGPRGVGVGLGHRGVIHRGYRARPLVRGRVFAPNRRAIRRF